MLKYILSRPYSVNTQSPTITNGKVSSFSIIQKDPAINNSTSINKDTGVITYIGSTDPQISYNVIRGKNSGGEHIDYMYTVSPIELSSGVVMPLSSHNVKIPNYEDSIEIEFTNGGNITSGAGGYLAVLPVETNDVFDDTDVTTNVIDTDYYVSNTIHSYDFSKLNLDIVYPIKVGFPVTGVTESEFLNVKLYQNSGGTITEPTTTYGTYSSVTKSGIVFGNLNDINTVAVVTAARHFTPFEVYTGITVNTAGQNWEANNNNKTTIYLETPTVLTTDNDKLSWWVLNFTGNTFVYSNNTGTLYVPPNPPSNGTPVDNFGIFHVYRGWFAQITNTSQLVKVGQPRQRPRQIIPVYSGKTEYEACANKTKTYVFNDSIVASDFSERKNNFTELTTGSTITYSKESSFPYAFAGIQLSTNSSARVPDGAFLISPPLFWPSSKTPCCGYGPVMNGNVIIDWPIFRAISGKLVNNREIDNIPKTCSQYTVLGFGDEMAISFEVLNSAAGVSFPSNPTLYPFGFITSDIETNPTEDVTPGGTIGTSNNNPFPLPLPGWNSITIKYTLESNTPSTNYIMEVYHNYELVYQKYFNDSNLTGSDVFRTFTFSQYLDKYAAAGVFSEGNMFIDIKMYAGDSPYEPEEDIEPTPTPTPTATLTSTITLTPTPTATTAVQPTPTTTPPQPTPTTTTAGVQTTPTPTPTATTAGVQPTPTATTAGVQTTPTSTRPQSTPTTTPPAPTPTTTTAAQPTPTTTTAAQPTPTRTQPAATPTTTPPLTPTTTPPSQTCVCYFFANEGNSSVTVFYIPCGQTNYTSETVNVNQTLRRCCRIDTNELPYSNDQLVTFGPCTTTTDCTTDTDCNFCQ